MSLLSLFAPGSTARRPIFIAFTTQYWRAYKIRVPVHGLLLLPMLEIYLLEGPDEGDSDGEGKKEK